MEKIRADLEVGGISASSVSRITKELDEKVEDKNLFMTVFLKKS
jgi:transposase-like protein